MMRTVSPIVHSFLSSCALKRTDLRTNFLYVGMRDPRLGHDDDRLVHLVGRDTSLLDATTIARVVRLTAVDADVVVSCAGASGDVSTLCCSMLGLRDPLFADRRLDLGVLTADRLHATEI